MNPLDSLAQEVGVNERTLRRAVGQGTLRGRWPTPRKLELPLSEREYVRRWWPLISRLRAALRTDRNVRLALLFGSAARGSDEPGSDVDVLVDLRDASLERVVDLELKLEQRAGRPVDVVRLEDAEADPSFLAALLADGRVLVDRDRLWPQLQRREPALRRSGRRRQAERVAAARKSVDRLLAS